MLGDGGLTKGSEISLKLLYPLYVVFQNSMRQVTSIGNRPNLFKILCMQYL